MVLSGEVVVYRCGVLVTGTSTAEAGSEWYGDGADDSERFSICLKWGRANSRLISDGVIGFHFIT